MRSIERQIWETANSNPDKTAIVCGKRQITYAELIKGISFAKSYFESLPKYRQGQIVIISANKGIEFVYAYFGAHLANLIAAPLDAQCNYSRLDYIIEMTDCNYIIGFDKFETKAKAISLSEFNNLKESSEITRWPELSSIADILFTTGTTGSPKGVPLSYANEAAAARNINEYIGNTSEDIELLALPISHSFGLGRLRCCLSIGQTLYLLGSFVNVKRLMRILKEGEISGFSMVPSSWKYLQKLSGDQLGEAGRNLKYIEMGSASLSIEDKKHLSKLLPNTRVCMHYGLTEASRSAFLEFHQDSNHLSSVGKASPNTEIAIFDGNGNPVRNSVEGEICIKGEHVTSGYYHQDNSDSYFGSYIRTGDYGKIDEDGYVTLSARIKDIINVGGKKVSPSEVEEAIIKIPGISDCACVGVRDTNGVMGEVVEAFVVREDKEITGADITNALNGKIEAYKIPVFYHWIDEIPRTGNGKILRTQLKHD